MPIQLSKTIRKEMTRAEPLNVTFDTIWREDGIVLQGLIVRYMFGDRVIEKSWTEAELSGVDISAVNNLVIDQIRADCEAVDVIVEEPFVGGPVDEGNLNPIPDEAVVPEAIVSSEETRTRV